MGACCTDLVIDVTNTFSCLDRARQEPEPFEGELDEDDFVEGEFEDLDDVNFLGDDELDIDLLADDLGEDEVVSPQ